MNRNDNKEGIDLAPRPSKDGLFSVDDFDKFFDDFITRKWHRLLDWNMPSAHAQSVHDLDISHRDNKKD